MHWHVYGYAFSNRQICNAWSIKKIFEFAQFMVVSLSSDECQKNIFLSLLIWNWKPGLASHHTTFSWAEWREEMWIDLHAHVKCFRARFILSSSWFIDWVTFWYFLAYLTFVTDSTCTVKIYSKIKILLFLKRRDLIHNFGKSTHI